MLNPSAFCSLSNLLGYAYLFTYFNCLSSLLWL